MWSSIFVSLNVSLLFSVQNIQICAHTLEISINVDVILSGNTSYRRKSPHLARFNASKLSDPISHWGDRVSIIVKKNYTLPNWETFFRYGASGPNQPPSLTGKYSKIQISKQSQTLDPVAACLLLSINIL